MTSSSATLQCHCGELLPVTTRDAGQRITCHCGRTIEVPAETPPALLETGAPLHVRKRRRKRRSAAGARAPRPRGPSRLTRLRQRARGWRGSHRKAARAVRRIVWAYGAVTVLAAIALWSVGDRWLPATLLLFGGRWLLLLPLVVLVPLAIALTPRTLGSLALVTVVVLGPVMGLRLGLTRLAGAPAGERLRVVTFDAGGGAVVSGHVDRALGRWLPDVVAFQECGAPLAQVVRTLPGWYHHASPDICLLSRFPIRAAAAMPAEALEASRTVGYAGAGAAVRYDLDAPGGPVHLTVVHLDAARRGLESSANLDLALLDEDTGARELESRQAHGWATAAASPIVVGDFNLPVESRIYRAAWGDLRNAFSEVGIGFGHTRRARWLRVRIDHVLYGDGWRATDAWVAPDEGSDHRPLVVDLVRTR